MSRRRWILPALVVPALFGLWSACGYSPCADLGGKCVQGGSAQLCQGTLSQQDCNPNSGTGGSFCCVPCPQGKVFDAGACM